VVIPGALLTAAQRYAELGYRVFPCTPGTKHPITRHGFRDASSDPAQIHEWWAQHPTANIGIAAEGLLVVDIDGADNPWPGDPERAVDLAGAGAVALTPRGGRHFLFRRVEGKAWKCSTGQLACGVDVRTDGGYIVAAPSETKEGPYRWADTLELEDCLEQLPEPPAWLVAELDGLATQTPPLAPRSPTAGQGLPDANPIPSGQRNATLAKLAGTMRRVGMGLTEITAALRAANQTRCVPPLDEREVERIAASVARYAPDEVSVALAENHYEQMQAKWEDDEAELPFPDPGPVPDSLLCVPGFVNEVMQYTLATAPYPEPVMAFAGALALQSLLAGRKVRDGMNGRTNLYILGLAFSGVGKEHPRQVNARILQAIGMASCLGDTFASGEGIEDSVFAHPASLYQVDEIDGLLLRISQAKDARHEAIVSILLKLFTSAGTVYTKRAKAGKEREQIDQPCLCLLGTAGPKLFYEALSPRMMTNGFLARMLVVECRGRVVGRDDVDLPLPASIVETARWWADFKPGGNLDNEHPDPIRVPTTPEARRAIKEFKDAIDEGPYKTAQIQLDDPGMALWSRAGEKAHRLALIYACSADRENPVITLDAARWAVAFALHQTQRMMYMMRRHASESEFDSKRKRLLDILERWRTLHGDEWMPGYKLNRQLPWSIREHEEVRDTLLQQRLIEYQAVPPGRKGGRPGMCYRLRPTQENATGGY
jgi:hypothetical protein